MKMLALLGLALPGMALAQTVQSADKWEGTPQVSLKTQGALNQPRPPQPASPQPLRAAPAPAPRATPTATPAPGITWQNRPVAQGAPVAAPAPARAAASPAPAATATPAPAATAQVRPAPAPATQAPPPGVSWQNRAATGVAAPRAQAAPLPTRPAEVRRSVQSRPVSRPAPPEAEAPVAPEQAPLLAAQADDYRAIRAGDRVTGAWSHPFYELDPVELGLAPPPGGARWIRYVDGALLVDASGSVLDTRWDLPAPIAPQYQPGGVPAYVGSGEWRTMPRDYAMPLYGATAGPPAMMVIETTTTTTRGGRPRR